MVKDTFQVHRNYKIKAFFEDNLKKDIIIYQEYHALIVEHAKRYYKKKSTWKDCPLLKDLINKVIING